MTEELEATTRQVGQLGNKTVPTPYQPSATWTALYDEFRLSMPVEWRCPCGSLLYGNKSCPKCGRVPCDKVNGKLDGSQRCTTGRQGRDYKRLAKRGRC